ncbi:hypothetical protein C0Q70_17383 [Pomacea canaliculata]|uniref:NADP-dependent oxidoreductase domain-containing protein n=1 Tax=Pomacea canaliculata TaxID=400727 RepID=A0A2T7NK97_POMCA|nr:uncharacterized protein LOC112576328 [Pomacea canaliculata]PVD21585.1 hypothetical protein C0Q70_17383 [Pomacea canaliculata]
MANIPDDAKCQYNFLGKSGLRVSNICLGTNTFGGTDRPGQLNEAASHENIKRFVEWGGNFFDTANVYSRGESEKVLGTWLSSQERDRFVIATKVRSTMEPDNPNGAGVSRKHISKSIDDSLKRLQTDYIDLYQLHSWDGAVPLEETLLTLNDLVRCGKVRYLGVSNYNGWQLQKITDLAEKMGLNPFISLQQQYNLLSRFSELEPFQVCKVNGIGVLPYSPLKGGFLAGKVKKGQVPEEGRLKRMAERDQNPAGRGQGQPGRGQMHNQYSILTSEEKNWQILEVLERIATAKGKSIAQVALRWLLQKPVVSSVIIGATKVSQIDDNMVAAAGWELSPVEMSELDKVSAPSLPYPYDRILRMNSSRVNPWNPAGYKVTS